MSGIYRVLISAAYLVRVERDRSTQLAGFAALKRRFGGRVLVFQRTECYGNPVVVSFRTQCCECPLKPLFFRAIFHLVYFLLQVFNPLLQVVRVMPALLVIATIVR